MPVDRGHLYKKYIDETTSYTIGKSNAWEVIIYLFLFKMQKLHFILEYPQHIHSDTWYMSVPWSRKEATDSFQNRKDAMVRTCNLNVREAKAEESPV